MVRLEGRVLGLVESFERIDGLSKNQLLFTLLALECLERSLEATLRLIDVSQGALRVLFDKKLDFSLHAEEEHFHLVLGDLRAG